MAPTTGIPTPPPPPKVSPDGVHSEAGGRFGHPHPPEPMRNQAFPALDPFILHELPPHKLKEIKVSELRFAMAVSKRAAEFYEEILDIVST